MLHLTKRVDYALIALADLALHPQERKSTRELAEAYELSQPLLANVLKDLGKGELVTSVRGTKGGYRLAQPADQVTVGRVVEILEGPLRLAECIGRDPRDHLHCSVSRVCPVKQSVFQIHIGIRDVLFGMTLADLSKNANGPGERLPVATPTPNRHLALASQPSAPGVSS